MNDRVVDRELIVGCLTTDSKCIGWGSQGLGQWWLTASLSLADRHANIHLSLTIVSRIDTLSPMPLIDFSTTYASSTLNNRL
jgi:hypothetical protein